MCACTCADIDSDNTYTCMYSWIISISILNRPHNNSYSQRCVYLLMQANELKMQGNAALKKEDVGTAVKLYTKAIELDPNNHALYTNRSMALCRQAKYERALRDAETSIQLKADWTKVAHVAIK